MYVARREVDVKVW